MLTAAPGLRAIAVLEELKRNILKCFFITERSHSAILLFCSDIEVCLDAELSAICRGVWPSNAGAFSSFDIKLF